MEKLKSLTAEELFFLGRLINGPYIDYAYVAAMDDIQHAYNSHEQKNMMSLQKKGLVFENFLGETNLMEKGNAYRPVFFGKFMLLILHSQLLIHQILCSHRQTAMWKDNAHCRKTRSPGCACSI